MALPTRRRRTTILIEGDASLRRALAAEVRAACDVVELEPPRAGLTMVRMRESARRTVFHLGEVLITEAKVEIAGHTGLGLIAGDDEDAASDLATIDAACNARLALTAEWTDRLEAEERALAARRAAEHAQLLETRVRFDSLDGDA